MSKKGSTHGRPGSSAPGALDGVRVADFTRVLAGPYATMLLGDFGADVVKVERPGTGDDTRSWAPPVGPDGESTYFESVNRNKSGVRIDLGSDEGLRAARDLIAASDVLVHNFAPGTMARFGLDYESLRIEHPDLIYCEISGFGDAAGAALPGYDLLAQALGGLMSITGPDPEHPTKVGVAVVDVICGLHATAGILAALHHRTATGEGQLVQVNLLSSLLSAMVNQSQAVIAADARPVAMGNAHPSIAPYETYRAAERDVVIAVGNDRQFAALCGELGLDEVAADPRFATNPARVKHRAELNELLAPAVSSRNAGDLAAALTARRVPAGAVNSIAEGIALASALGLEPIALAGGSVGGSVSDSVSGSAGSPADGSDVQVPTISNPIRLSATPVQYRLPPPVGTSD